MRIPGRSVEDGKIFAKSAIPGVRRMTRLIERFSTRTYTFTCRLLGRVNLQRLNILIVCIKIIAQIYVLSSHLQLVPKVINGRGCVYAQV